MKEKLKKLQVDHKILKEEYQEIYYEEGNQTQKCILLDKMKSIETTFQNLGLNVNHTIDFDKL